MDESNYVVELKTTGYQEIPIKVYKVVICEKTLYRGNEEEWETLAYVISEDIYDGRHIRFFWNKPIYEKLNKWELQQIMDAIPEFVSVRAGTTILEYVLDPQQKVAWWL